jgi:hypothetical protein
MPHIFISGSSTGLGLMGPPETSNAKNACLALQSQAYRFLRNAIISQCSRRIACETREE